MVVATTVPLFEECRRSSILTRLTGKSLIAPEMNEASLKGGDPLGKASEAQAEVRRLASHISERLSLLEQPLDLPAAEGLRSEKDSFSFGVKCCEGSELQRELHWQFERNHLLQDLRLLAGLLSRLESQPNEARPAKLCKDAKETLRLAVRALQTTEKENNPSKPATPVEPKKRISEFRRRRAFAGRSLFSVFELDDALLQRWAEEVPSDEEEEQQLWKNEGELSKPSGEQQLLRRELENQRQTEAQLNAERRQRELLFSAADVEASAHAHASEKNFGNAGDLGADGVAASDGNGNEEETGGVEEALATAADDLRAGAIRFRHFLNADNDRLQKMQQKQSELQGEAAKGCTQTKKLLRSEWFAAFLPLVLLAVSLCIFLAMAALIFATPG